MSFISLVAFFCILIEVWHIIYHTFLYDKYFKRPFTVVNWAENYEKLYDSFIEFSDGYINNLDLQQELTENESLTEVTLLEMSNVLFNLGRPKECKSKILDLCTMKQWWLVILQQFIEYWYWINIIIIALIMPNCFGLLIYFVMRILSYLQTKFNKDMNYVFLGIDSICCTILWCFVLIWFF